MNCWAILGIERTSDTTLIRKAYKQKLLVHHPEDDPAGYQTVRAAYTAAMNEAKRAARSAHANNDANPYAPADTEAETAEDADVGADRLSDFINRLEDASEQDEAYEGEARPVVQRRYFAAETQDKIQAVNDFMTRLMRLYNDHNQRNDLEAWKELLNDDVLWDLQSKSVIKDRMLQFFSQQHNLNDDIWKLIEAHTALFDTITKNSNKYPARFVDTYALATQKIAVSGSRKQDAVSKSTIIKTPDVSWWKYCFYMPISWIILAIIGSFIVIPIYLLTVFIRIVLFVKMRNWKIIMREYTFTYSNSWGIRSHFKYIDILKVVQKHNIVIVYLKRKRIRIKADRVEHINYLLAKMSRYGTTDGNAINMRESVSR
ncbi:J domain-containing protein [Paenibacillus sp. NEAU-GSW1]|uniref:J domain-containing protein n=1 Tax=Paenibacillus sp. NEAU-GSW1 TaxID=2682486 RepID=UPI0012E2CCF5|nr:J domain-containing protein [Paenibacillus sp. NEAU-GSW1]MUT64896.1 hypothetical protein [Paenibacillus sp. NEAU-GSW1]